ncbi:uncharacterized protein BT62DRAFT_627529 [Guyanagaster necrorhizus]|uniref:Uncharacterized protein n=1 Tax=Guyanagaster necrorhizus TaxID=856835 RepID=A0A9P8AKY5_9AGAR|nr:uncharacterized protein BT62DRAFT_773441 [Guyanagaster necrorhizus MCA 3950]XP_043033797.1 uncharacterized protein BT62DRAFT_627529 [Guyanagaster necrorhizus MCA 3950]KAG7439190.1 hypothetical protein BT62DRAFT_773441 [Guyanagaster necrorhizus MCA 3950]KAG7440297.1 hypothetical protein BT62DRAFT_627529 [Guyanagaster necrorhizus MCA 3950]
MLSRRASVSSAGPKILTPMFRTLVSLYQRALDGFQTSKRDARHGVTATLDVFTCPVGRTNPPAMYTDVQGTASATKVAVFQKFACPRQQARASV